MTPDELAEVHPLLHLAVDYARQSLALTDRNGEYEDEAEAIDWAEAAGDLLVAWVGGEDRHPYYYKAF